MPVLKLIERLPLGAAAGFAGTLALQGLMAASQKWFPETMPPIRKDPGEFMVEKVEQSLPAEVSARVPDIAETAGARSLALGYGMTAGTIYAALRPCGKNVIAEGSLLGLGTWAVGYLGWLPALGLMPPVPKQGLKEAAGPLLQHVVFGVVSVAAYRKLLSLRSSLG
jgi:hypothetical protein